MKRTPLRRRKPLSAKPSTGTKKALPYRSKKMEQIYVERRRLVKEMLEANPLCEGGELIWHFDTSHRCTRTTTEVHEILTRARGGSILDKDNCVALCHSCHAWITEHPKEAHAMGMMKNSWD